LRYRRFMFKQIPDSVPKGLHYLVQSPDKVLQDYRDTLRLTQKEIAIEMGVTPKTVSLLMNGKARITVRIAKALEIAFKRPAHFWLNLQANWDLGRSMLDGDEPVYGDVGELVLGEEGGFQDTFDRAVHYKGFPKDSE